MELMQRFFIRKGSVGGGIPWLPLQRYSHGFLSYRLGLYLQTHPHPFLLLEGFCTTFFLVGGIHFQMYPPDLCKSFEHETA